MKDTSLTLITLQVVSVLGAGIFLLTSRSFSLALIPAILLLGIAIFLAGYSRYQLFSILIIGMFTSLILALRFDYLPWGDPWFDYEMVLRILTYQSINPSVYQAQLPVIHLIITSLSIFSSENPLVLLKYIIPLLSVIGLYAVYRFIKKVSTSAETAFFAGILLLCGTPYLHWTTQGVRETMGIALFALTLYVSFTALQSNRKGYLCLSLLLIGGLVLTHDLSSVIFLVVWIAVSLTFLYLICDMNRIRTTGLFSFLIASTAVIFIVTWGWGRPIFGYSLFSSLMDTFFHSEFGIPLFILILSILYLLPLRILGTILALRSIVAKILIRKNTIYAIIITGTGVSIVVVLNFIMGKSSFDLSYPLPMFFNGICMIFLTLIGIYYFLEIGRLHIIAWIAVLGLLLILSMCNIVPFVDPLRFMEFLYIPMAVIAAFGVTWIAELAPLAKIFPFVLAVFVIVSVITSFPSIVFWGNTFEPGHPLYDTRSFVIQHQASEISAISWIENSYAVDVIETDAYVGYAARGIISTGAITVKTEYPFVKEGGYPQSISKNTQQHYLLILSRFMNYMEFSDQWMRGKIPLSKENLIKIDRDCNILYDNGDAVIFSYST